MSLFRRHPYCAVAKDLSLAILCAREPPAWSYLPVANLQMRMRQKSASLYHTRQTIYIPNPGFLRPAAHERVPRWYNPSDISPSYRIAVGYQPHTMFDQRGAILYCCYIKDNSR